MRASVSLTSFFSSLRSPTIPSHLFIPIIRIINPPNAAPPRLSAGLGGIRRWRGALGALGDLTLQLPSQGLTSGARLALARQGCATGSFRLNCSESLYVRDSLGLAMFQRIELEEELDKARLGLRERPPMLGTSETDGTDPPNNTFNSMAGHRKPRRPSLRSQKRNMLATQSMRFESTGLSSCVTFTEGLCNLEDYIRANEADSPSTTLPTVHSEQEISRLSASSEAPNLSWLDSLRKKTFSSVDKTSKVKKRRSASDLVRSISCIDFDISLSEADMTLNVDISSSSSGSDDSGHFEGQLKSTSCQEVDADCVGVATSNKLRREGSWTRLRRRLSGKVSFNEIEIATALESMESSASVRSGLFQLIQHGMPTTTFIRPSVHVLS